MQARNRYARKTRRAACRYFRGATGVRAARAIRCELRAYFQSTGIAIVFVAASATATDAKQPTSSCRFRRFVEGDVRTHSKTGRNSLITMMLTAYSLLRCSVTEWLMCCVTGA